jgi:acyl-CoA synthetase (AMP-forming)/AMP-acid ligase II
VRPNIPLHALGGITSLNALAYPEKIAFANFDRTISWAELDEQASSFATGLRGYGIVKGEHVALLGGNDIEWVIAQFGIWKVGAVPTFIHGMLADSLLVRQLNQSETVAIVAGPQFADRLSGLIEQAQSVRLGFCWGNEVKGIPSVEEIIDSFSSEEADTEVLLDDVAAIIYSSGTTGIPKGAVNTYHDWLAKDLAQIVAQELKPQETGMIVTPLYMGGSQIISLVPFARLSMTCVLLQNFDPEHVLSAIDTFGVNTFFAVPTMLKTLVDYPNDRWDTSSLKRVVSSGSPLNVQLYHSWIDRFGAGVYEVCGTSETGGGLSMTQADRESGKVSSVGRPMVGFEVRIVDPEGHEVPQGKRGEMLYRGDAVASGYYRQPDIEREIFKNGWFHTGDIGYVDKDGYFYIVDRIKDLVITGGFNVYPHEVEDVLYELTEIRECAVIGVPDAVWGEAVHAVVALHPDSTTGQSEILLHCRERLAKFQVPKNVHIMDSLPKTSVGKIDKNRLREL